MGRSDAGVLYGTPYGPSGGSVQGRSIVAPVEPGCFQAVEAHAFAHPAEQDLARILSFYRIRWVYEPTTFHLEVREDGRPAEQITPDFYLPDHDLFIELTTMRQRLVTRKNRKIRRLREIFPALRIKLLYRRDYDRLVGSYPVPDQILDPQLGTALIGADDLQRRVAELAAEIFDSSRGCSMVEDDSVARQRSAPLHLIGVGSGVRQFLRDLAAAMDKHECCVTTDHLMVSRYANGHEDERVRIGHSLKIPIAGRDIVLVADIISSGLSLVYVIEWLRSKGARSVRVCALLDRADARIIDIPLDFVGFRAPDEILVGYGLSSYRQFRSLSYIAAVQESIES